jgi:Holliday junction resolvase RusA-like endonuclease
MKEVRFHVTGTPIPQGSKRVLVNPVTKRAVVVDANRYGLSEWRRDVTTEGIHAMSDFGVSRFEDGVVVNLAFEFTRPGNHWLPINSKRLVPVLRPNAPLSHVQTPDLDKLIRAILDALTAANVWADDKQVVACHATKFWCDYGDQPGVGVVVQEKAS